LRPLSVSLLVNDAVRIGILLSSWCGAATVGDPGARRQPVAIAPRQAHG
jgi:hypothetical protein